MVGLDYLFVLAHDIVLKRKELKKLLFCASKVRIVFVASEFKVLSHVSVNFVLH